MTRNLPHYWQILRIGRRTYLRVYNSMVPTHPGMQVRRDISYARVALTTGYAGVLHLLYSCVLMIFWRVFMRISYSCPAHLQFALTIESWSNLVQLTGDAIDWLDRNDKLYDVWMLVAYAATSCALVQVSVFHTRITHGAPILCIPCHCGHVVSTVSHVGTSPRS